MHGGALRAPRAQTRCEASGRGRAHARAARGAVPVLTTWTSLWRPVSYDFRRVVSGEVGWVCFGVVFSTFDQGRSCAHLVGRVVDGDERLLGVEVLLVLGEELVELADLLERGALGRKAGEGSHKAGDRRELNDSDVGAVGLRGLLAALRARGAAAG